MRHYYGRRKKKGKEKNVSNHLSLRASSKKGEVAECFFSKACGNNICRSIFYNLWYLFLLSQAFGVTKKKYRSEQRRRQTEDDVRGDDDERGEEKE